MKPTRRAAIRIGDVIIVAGAIALASVLGVRIYSNDTAHTVRVTAGHHEHHDYPAWQSQQIRVQGPLGETVIEIADGRARVAASPCSRKLCIRSGWLDAAGAATACVPNRVSLVLLGDDPRFDAMNF